MTARLGVALLLAAALAGCATRPATPPAIAPLSPPAVAPAAPAAPPPFRLSRTNFNDLPGWNAAAFEDARASFRRGCAALARRDAGAAMGGAGYAGAVRDWLSVCNDTNADARNFFQSRFTPYAISSGIDTNGLFTGYYEPLIEASRARGGVYQTPVYGLPADLVQVNLSAFGSRYAGQRISGRVENGRLVPYATRAQINARPPNAPILLWAADPVAVFFLEIQGSGRARLPDGSMVRLAYAGGNGQPYTPIGRTLINENQLTRENVSLQSIRAWLKANPTQAQRVMETNLSYVFFQQEALAPDVPGPNGTLGVPLTPKASLAIDARLNALGAPFFVVAEGRDPVQALMIGQDTGGAISGAVRGDIFFGFGAEAEQRAGFMNAPGRLYVLLPNELAAQIGQGRDYPL
jgi:membrane-bound lytic murein transglycosylase A